MGEIYTIGHTHHTIAKFLAFLDKYNIDYLMDVRSVPYSRYAEQFNREALKKVMDKTSVKYVFMGNYFGARQQNPDLYNEAGYLDFEKVRSYQPFIMRVDNLILGLKKGNNIALMCTEKHPIDCHRAILIARAFELKGIGVKHILEDGSCITQDELNQNLLEMYFPKRNQMSLFEATAETDEDYLIEAYRLRNKEIGYHLNGSNDVESAM